MITQTQIDDIWNHQAIHASRAEVGRILAAFDRLNTQAAKTPLEVGPGQKVFVRNTDAGDDDEFNSLKEAQDYLQGQCEDRDWDDDYVSDYITVIVGREVSVESKKTFTVAFS